MCNIMKDSVFLKDVEKIHVFERRRKLHDLFKNFGSFQNCSKYFLGALQLNMYVKLRKFSHIA